MLNYKEWKINQFVAGCIITFGGFGFGTSLAWTATALPKLEEGDLVGNLTSTQSSWVASIMTIGALVACPVTGLFLREMGRKTCLIAFTCVGFSGWILLASATNPIQLYVGRCLLGISSGGYTIFVPIYVSEIASKKNRGLIGSMFLIMVCLGKLFSNAVGVVCSVSTASLLCSLLSLIYGVNLFLIPESPKILMKQSKEKEAFTSLSWYEAKGAKSIFSCRRRVDLSSEPIENTTMELWNALEMLRPMTSSRSKGDDVEQSQHNCKHTKEGDYTNRALNIWSPSILKPLCTVYIQMMLVQFCGMNVSTFYTVEIFRMSGDFLDPEQATVLLALIQTIGCLPCSIFVDKYGRKLLLVSSFVFMGLAMACFSAFFYFKDSPNFDDIQDNYPYIGVIPLISLVIYNLAYCWGVGSVAWIVISEIIPPSIIGPASAFANVIFWGCAFLIIQSFQMFKDQIPMYTWFIIFTFFCVFGVIFNLFFFPETKGLSLQDIQKFYNKGHDINSKCDSKIHSKNTRDNHEHHHHHK